MKFVIVVRSPWKLNGSISKTNATQNNTGPSLSSESVKQSSRLIPFPLVGAGWLGRNDPLDETAVVALAPLSTCRLHVNTFLDLMASCPRISELACPSGASSSSCRVKHDGARVPRPLWRPRGNQAWINDRCREGEKAREKERQREKERELRRAIGKRKGDGLIWLWHATGSAWKLAPLRWTKCIVPVAGLPVYTRRYKYRTIVNINLSDQRSCHAQLRPLDRPHGQTTAISLRCSSYFLPTFRLLSSFSTSCSST